MSGWVGGNRYLTQSEMEINATYIYNFLSTKGWTKNAIAGMFGNLQTESSINPQIWQGLDANHPEPWGYGLVQWTPSTKLFEWASSQGLIAEDMDTQLKRVIYEKDNGLQWGTTSDYPIGFDEFVTSIQTPAYLANAWMYNYERPATLNQPQRAAQAENWFTFLSGVLPPVPPIKSKRKSHKLPVYLFFPF